MLTYSKRRLLFWFSVLIFILLVPVVILYSLGYRLNAAWRLEKTGGLYAASSVSGSEIFVSGELQKRTNLLQSGVFIDNLTPGEYEILILHKDYLPWSKRLRVFSQLVSEARAVLVPAKIDAEIILRGKFKSEYTLPEEKIILLIQESEAGNVLAWYFPETREFLRYQSQPLRFRRSFEFIRSLPQGAVLELDDRVFRVGFDTAAQTVNIIPLGEESPKKTEEDLRNLYRRRDNRNFVEIFWNKDSKELKAKWLVPNAPLPYYFINPEEILISGKEIKNFEFYPARRDAVIAAFDNGIWVVELDGRGQRIVQPVYKGKDPNFVLFPDEDEVYILDDGILIKTSLFAEE